MKASFVFGLLASTASAHMQMSKPYPIRSPLNTASSEQKDYSYNNPLSTSGSDYPCKGYAHDTFVSQATYQPGSQYTMELSGSATHSGGSCQLALTYDLGKTFHVIESMLGECPISQKYDFKIPSDAPSGNALLAWTWFNKVGNREMYMNCAMVSIGGSSNRNKIGAGNSVKKIGGYHALNEPMAMDMTADEMSDMGQSDYNKREVQKALTSFGSLPELFVANAGQASGCVTIEGEPVNFPQPGDNVVGTASGTGYKCSGTAPFLAGSGSSGSSGSSSSSSSTSSTTTSSSSSSVAAAPSTLITSASSSSSAAPIAPAPTSSSSSQVAAAPAAAAPTSSSSSEAAAAPAAAAPTSSSSSEAAATPAAPAPTSSSSSEAAAAPAAAAPTSSSSSEAAAAPASSTSSSTAPATTSDSTDTDDDGTDNSDDFLADLTSALGDYVGGSRVGGTNDVEGTKAKQATQAEEDTKAVDSTKAMDSIDTVDETKAFGGAKAVDGTKAMGGAQAMAGTQASTNNAFSSYVGTYTCKDGEIICSPDGYSWALCDHSHPVFMGPVARGTECRSGGIVRAAW
ncbi:hypothetical protein N7495_006508 [Penicillium taxi]|uniref:uncharacterized protein n=1 Tax=Penicillium taxi TaxID=168475 RepID=UPI002545751A|nr:uncharacterized protein N7495_006508 [Penicillium taxi]KAJ5894817.1 hypothetical protein N7495_006508 [Penicillium taxi]